MNSDFREHSRNLRMFPDRLESGEITPAQKDITSTSQEPTRESREHSQKLRVLRIRDELSAKYEG